MLRRFIGGLLDIVYPRACLGCKDSVSVPSVDELICSKCWSGIKKNTPPFCYSCGRQLDKKNLTKHMCPTCIKQELHFDRAFSPCVYTGVVKELIREFKYNRKDHLGKPLSKLMTDFIKEYNVPVGLMDAIIPMPLHSARMREREFNQAQILGDNIAREFDRDLLSDVLVRHRHTKTQTGLETRERFVNVKDSFSVTKPEYIKAKNILVIDDVLTTGATSSEAARALKAAGAHIVYVLTLAN